MTYSEPLISKQDFVTMINSLRDKEDMVDKINDIIREYKTLIHDDFLDGNSIIIGHEEEVIKLLEILMKDTSGDISWFIWEMDFGRDFKMGDLTVDDKDIDVSTAEKLYDYLKKVNFNEYKEIHH